MLAQGARHPVPIARMIQAAVDQQQRREAILAPVPELQLKAIGIVVVGDGFQSNYCTRGPLPHGRGSEEVAALLLAHQRGVAHFGVMADVDALDQEQNVFGDVGGVVGDALQVMGDEHEVDGAGDGGAFLLHEGD